MKMHRTITPCYIKDKKVIKSLGWLKFRERAVRLEWMTIAYKHLLVNWRFKNCELDMAITKINMNIR